MIISGHFIQIDVNILVYRNDNIPWRNELLYCIIMYSELRSLFYQLTIWFHCVNIGYVEFWNEEIFLRSRRSRYAEFTVYYHVFIWYEYVVQETRAMEFPGYKQQINRSINEQMESSEE